MRERGRIFRFCRNYLTWSSFNIYENYNIKLRRGFTLSGTYGKGRTDFAITYIKKIFCVTEVKVSDLEYGFCENLIQVQTACQVSVILIPLFVL
jgi:hypothetical protein